MKPIALFLITFSFWGCQQQGELRNSQVSSIFGGSKILDDRFSYVVALSHPLSPIFCSGVLLSSTQVLTAAHCIAQYPIEGEIRDLRIYQGLAITSYSDAKTNVISYQIHPGYDPTIRNSEYDFAILTIQTPLSANYPYVPSKELLLKFFSENVKPLLLGFGKDEMWEKGALKVAETELRAIGPYTIRNYSAISSSCSADSGGPEIVTYLGKEYLIGIASTAYIDEWGECRGWNNYGRIDLIDDLLL